MTDKKKEKKTLTPADKAINAVIAVVIVAVLALAVWAVAPKVKEGWKNVNPIDTTKISGMAKNIGMTVDEFKAEFGLPEDITGKSATADVFTQEFVNTLPLSKYAKLIQTDFTALVEQMGIAGKVTEDTTYGEAELLIPLSVMAGGEEGFAQMKEYYGFEEGVTADTTYGEVKDFMATVDAQKAAEVAQAETPAENEEVPAEEVPAE